MAHFENCAEYNGWKDKDKLAYLKASLVGEAAQVLWDSDEKSVDTLKKLLNILRCRYSGSRQADKYRMELRLRRRRSGKTLFALHQDVILRRLMALAHPTLPQDARESIACDYYIDALDDADFALKVRERAPANLDEALRVSLQLEAWQKDARRRRDDGNQSKPKVRSSVQPAVPPEQSSSYLDDRFNRLEENLSRRMDELFDQAQKSLSVFGQKSSTTAATDRASGTERLAPDVSKPVGNVVHLRRHRYRHRDGHGLEIKQVSEATDNQAPAGDAVCLCT